MFMVNMFMVNVWSDSLVSKRSAKPSIDIPSANFDVVNVLLVLPHVDLDLWLRCASALGDGA